MNLEEKIKEIRDLCQNLDESKITSVYYDFVSQSIIKIHFKDGYKTFNLNDKNHYKHLIKHLEENQKEPELYTLEEIISIKEKWSEEDVEYLQGYNFIEYFKEHAKPYKKQS